MAKRKIIELFAQHGAEIDALERRQLERAAKLYQETWREIRAKLERLPEGTFTRAHFHNALNQVRFGIFRMQHLMQTQLVEGGNDALWRGIKNAMAETEAMEAEFAGISRSIPHLTALKLDTLADGKMGATPMNETVRRVLKNGETARKSENLMLMRYETSLNRYGADVIGRAGFEISKGVLAHEFPAQIIQRIAGEIKGSVASKAEASAERIFRTEMSNALNVGHLDAMQEMQAEFAPDLQKKWLAVAESPRTCEDCNDAHGQVVDLDEPFTVGGDEVDAPPDHPNCRCRVVPWREAWGEASDNLFADLAPGAGKNTLAA